MKTFKRILKQYLTALIFLLLVTFLMIIGTMAVTKFGNQMFENMETPKMTPRGEKVEI